MPKSFEEIVVTKLDQVLRVLSIGATNGLKQTEQIALLNRAGMPPKEIAELLGTTSNTVSVALSTRKKKRRVKRSKDNKRAD
jgi:DNA-binding CsgD family transcriptional regulator